MKMWMNVDAALTGVPVNEFPLIDDTDFKTRETGVAYDAAGMDLVWNFVTTGGVFTQTPVTPTTGGDYDWTHKGDAIYTIEIPASGGASINNDTAGFGWFTGVATGVLPWKGPVIGFRPKSINDALVAGTGNLRADIRAIIGSVISEANAGNLATNFATFWDAGDSTPGTTLELLEEIRDDTNEMQGDLEEGGRLDDLIDQAAGGGGGGSNPAVLQETTIATLTGQTEFTLTAGSPDDDAYNDALIVVTDGITETQKAVGLISDYVGSTRTVTLSAALAFTIAAGDSVAIIAGASAQKQAEILLALNAAPLRINSPANANSGIVSLIQGNAYSANANQAIPFSVAKDYTSGWTGTFTVRYRDTDDVELIEATPVSIVSSSSLTVALTKTQTAFSTLEDKDFARFDSDHERTHRYELLMTHTSSGDTESYLGPVNVFKP